jgi:hypothetical protein
MNEVGYLRIRVEHHSRLAMEETDPDLKAAHETIAAEMVAKMTSTDPNRQVVLVDGVAVDANWPLAVT